MKPTIHKTPPVCNDLKLWCQRHNYRSHQDSSNGVGFKPPAAWTMEDNAVKKAVQVSKFLKKLAVADDSGLEVEYLNGDPGVYSARFSGKGATYKSNNEKLLMLLKGVPLAKRKACFQLPVKNIHLPF